MNFKVYSRGREIPGEIILGNLTDQETGVFESLRTYRGKLFKREEHLKRFSESAKTAGHACDLKVLREELESAARAFQASGKASGGDLFIRITLWRREIIVMIGSRKHPDQIYKTGVALRTSPVRRSHVNAQPSGAKTTAYQNALLASLEPKSEEIYEWLFLDPQGFVTEVRIGNIFIIKDGELLTPPTTGILNGVTRLFVLECARQLKIRVKEVPISRHEIFNADEAFLTNTSWEILPVRELDGRRISAGKPGNLTQKLHKQFKKRVEEECR
jgi:branched-chain amino acid aminotransferase